MFAELKPIAFLPTVSQISEEIKKETRTNSTDKSLLSMASGSVDHFAGNEQGAK